MHLRKVYTWIRKFFIDWETSDDDDDKLKCFLLGPSLSLLLGNIYIPAKDISLFIYIYIYIYPPYHDKYLESVDG